jgi:hypothetical protein
MVAKTAYMASTCVADASWRTADRISGCRNCTSPSLTPINPSATAGSSASIDTGDLCSAAAARVTSASDARLSSAAASNTTPVSSGRSRNLAAKACSKRALSVDGAGAIRSRGAGEYGAVRGSSTRASGFPAASARTRARDTGCRFGTARSSTAAAASALKRPSSRIGRRASSNRAAYPVRTVATSATGTPSRRRAMNVSTPRLERSSQCASSASRTKGDDSAASMTRRNAAIATRNGSGSALSIVPKTALSGWRWEAGSSSIDRTMGKRS